jgi:hypothetical protein
MITHNCGARKCSEFKILRAGPIETTILEKGYMEARGELQGEKWCGLKPLLAALQSRVYVRS